MEIRNIYDKVIGDFDVSPKADLSGVDLRRANLIGANLSGANLSGADLSGADLSGVDLSGAKLVGADLRRVNLSGAGLSGADLRRTKLIGADLSGVDLSGANLRRANLIGANLRWTNGVTIIDGGGDKFTIIVAGDLVQIGCQPFRPITEWLEMTDKEAIGLGAEVKDLEYYREILRRKQES